MKIFFLLKNFPFPLFITCPLFYPFTCLLSILDFFVSLIWPTLGKFIKGRKLHKIQLLEESFNWTNYLKRTIRSHLKNRQAINNKKENGKGATLKESPKTEGIAHGGVVYKGILQNFVKFTKKHLSRSLFSVKLLAKVRNWSKYFAVKMNENLFYSTFEQWRDRNSCSNRCSRNKMFLKVSQNS